MKPFRLSSLGALTLCLAPLAAHAQASAPAAATGPGPAASAPAAAGKAAPPNRKPPPNLPTAQQKREQSAETGDLRPDRPISPQFNIPLGKPKHPVERTTPPRPGTTPAPSGSGINDSAARCNAESDPQARADCRAALAPAPTKTTKP